MLHNPGGILCDLYENQGKRRKDNILIFVGLQIAVLQSPQGCTPQGQSRMCL